MTQIALNTVARTKTGEKKQSARTSFTKTTTGLLENKGQIMRGKHTPQKTKPDSQHIKPLSPIYSWNTRQPGLKLLSTSLHVNCRQCLQSHSMYKLSSVALNQPGAAFIYLVLLQTSEWIWKVSDLIHKAFFFFSFFNLQTQAALLLTLASSRIL